MRYSEDMKLWLFDLAHDVWGVRRTNSITELKQGTM